MKNLNQKYKFTVIATDVVIFTIEEKVLKVLLIKMNKHPYKNHWALPGGLVKPEESVDHSAQRNLKEKTGVVNVYLEQLYTFGEINRDPFGRVVSVAYFALMPTKGVKLKTSKEYKDVKWFEVKELPNLAYDHKNMVNLAVKRLQAKLEYTNIVFSLLPKEFALSELQLIYEIILDKKLDKRNFRKKILSLNLLEKTEKKSKGANRPAQLYKFKERKPQIVNII